MANERQLCRNSDVFCGSIAPLDPREFEAENQPLDFSSPETDLDQFVLPATTGQSRLRLNFAKFNPVCTRFRIRPSFNLSQA